MSGPAEPKKAARVVQLYCPEHEATVDNLMITPSMDHDDFVKHVKAAFRQYDLQHVRPCDINGEPLWDTDKSPSRLDNVADGERLCPEPGLEVVLFLEDESLEKPLRKLGREARRDHMRTLRRADAPLRRNILRLILPHVEVAAALSAFNKASKHQLSSKYSFATSRRIIKEHWPASAVFESDQKCFAAVAILAGATSGQALVPIDFLFDAMLDRRQDSAEPREMQYEDVVRVIEILYKGANALGSEWPETKEHKGMGKHGEKKGAYGKAKVQEKQILDEMEENEELGEEAALAKRPGVKGGEMDSLAGLLEKKADVKDNEMVDSDEEEDAVRKPGRLQGA